MCVSMFPAKLSRTVGMVNYTNHPSHGPIVVVGYQNRVQNQHAGANAMILHFPAAEEMTQANFIDTTSAPNILKDMVAAITPATRGYLSYAKGLNVEGIRIFEYGIYTVAVTSNASLLYRVLQSDVIPADRRPDINKEVFDFYQHELKDHGFALCCFNNSEASLATPILVWYEPNRSDTLAFPGIDAHNGEAPNLYEMVEVDHTIILASDGLGVNGYEVHYTDRISPELAAYLPKYVVGRRSYSGKMPNADFLFSRREMEETGDMPRLTRGIL